MKDLVPYVVLFALAGSLWGWTQAVSKLIAKQPILPRQPRRPVPWGSIDLVLTLFAAVFFQLLVQIVLERLFHVDSHLKLAEMPPEMSAEAILGGSCASLLTMVGSLWIVRLRTGARWSDVGFDRRMV